MGGCCWGKVSVPSIPWSGSLQGIESAWYRPQETKNLSDRRKETALSDRSLMLTCRHSDDT